MITIDNNNNNNNNNNKKIYDDVSYKYILLSNHCINTYKQTYYIIYIHTVDTYILYIHTYINSYMDTCKHTYHIYIHTRILLHMDVSTANDGCYR